MTSNQGLTSNLNLIANKNQNIFKDFFMNRLKRILKNWQLYLLISPALTFIIVFCYLPLYGAQIAFKDFYASLGIVGSPWVGFKHFETFFHSIFFQRVFLNTLGLGVYMLGTLWTPILLALMINEVKNKRFMKAVQNISYAPYFISTIVMVGMLYIFLSPTDGVVNKIIMALGMKPIEFMTDAVWFKTVYVISNVWQNVGWASIIYVAALSGVDLQLIESSVLDGATKLQRIWHISLPVILPTIVVVFLINIGNLMNMGSFEKVFGMQNSLNMDSSDIIQTYVYRTGLMNAKYSLSTAIGLFNSFLNMIILLISNSLAKRATGTNLW